MAPYEFIEEYQTVLSCFGQWPSFHDGEVHRVVLDRMHRSSQPERYCANIEMYLRGWIMTPEVAEGGFYKLNHDSVVHFRFEDVYDVEFDGFNHQNVLSSLNLSLVFDSKESKNRLHVELEHCYGLSGSFSAHRAMILSVVPFVRKSDV